MMGNKMNFPMFLSMRAYTTTQTEELQCAVETLSGCFQKPSLNVEKIMHFYQLLHKHQVSF